MVAQKKQENRKLRIEKIGKIGNFVLKNRRKIGKSIVVSLTKIASLHHIRARIKATNPQLLCLQDLDQLSRLRRSKNDQWCLVYRLSYPVIRMVCLTTGRVWFYNQRWSHANSLQVGSKSLKSFEEWNFLRLRRHWRISQGVQFLFFPIFWAYSYFLLFLN